MRQVVPLNLVTNLGECREAPRNPLLDLYQVYAEARLHRAVPATDRGVGQLIGEDLAELAVDFTQRSVAQPFGQQGAADRFRLRSGRQRRAGGGRGAGSGDEAVDLVLPGGLAGGAEVDVGAFVQALSSPRQLETGTPTAAGASRKSS